jgi:catechol 2,3-dioxygenase-like lactoylglutathione lyase family enzyme
MKHNNNVLQMCGITRRDFITGALGMGVAGAALRLEAALPAAGLDHVNIRVPDVRHAAEFYIKLFGAQVARAPNAKAQTANPASPSGELWFIRLGESFLAISPTGSQLKPGIDHFCFAIAGFNGDRLKFQLAGLNQQWPDSPSNNLWLKDPAGHVIQLSAPGDSSRVPGSGVGAVLVEPAGGARREPAFQAARITELTLAVPKIEPSANYYRKLLGKTAETQQHGRFRVGQSAFMLGPASGGESFRVGVIGFDPSAVASRLKNLGVSAAVARDKRALSFRDPDGIRVEIGG